MKSSFTDIVKRFPPPYTSKQKLMTFWYMMWFAIRGLLHRIFIKKVKGILLVGRNVRIAYPSHLNVGSNTIIEDGVEINALSTEGIHLGDRVTIGKYAIIRPSNLYGASIGVGLTLGNKSNIGPYSYVGCSGKITIGNNVMMGPRVSLFAENHIFENTDINIQAQGVTTAPIVIEDDCWIASNVVILAGVTIGKGTVIAAGSVVNANFPAYSVIAGVPAKLIKSRKSE